MTFDLIKPDRILSDVLNRAFLIVDLPSSNNEKLQKLLCDLFVASMMASVGSKRKDDIVKEFKATYAAQIKRAVPNTPTLLEEVSPFALSVKVANPRTQFDKDKFIKEIAAKYDLSMIELNTIAKSCVKSTAAPVSFEVSTKDAPF